MRAAALHVLVIWAALGLPLGLAIGAAITLSHGRHRGAVLKRGPADIGE